MLDPDGRPMRDVLSPSWKSSTGIPDHQQSGSNPGRGHLRHRGESRSHPFDGATASIVVGSEPRVRRSSPIRRHTSWLSSISSTHSDRHQGRRDRRARLPHAAAAIGSIKATISGPNGYSLDDVRALRPEAIRSDITVSDGIGYLEGLREGRYIVAAAAVRVMACWRRGRAFT